MYSFNGQTDAFRNNLFIQKSDASTIGDLVAEAMEKVTAEIISLPIYPELPPEAVDYVSETLSKLL